MRALLIRERASAAVCGQLTCRGGSRGVVKSNDIRPARLRRVRPLRSEVGRNPVEGGILDMPAALGGRGTASWATLALRVGSKMCHLIVLNPVRADAHARACLPVLPSRAVQPPPFLLDSPHPRSVGSATRARGRPERLRPIGGSARSTTGGGGAGPQKTSRASKEFA
jgi:hypothetical protein